MAYERKWAAVSPQPFTANGGQFGLVTLADTAGFRVKQSAYLTNNSGLKQAVQIKLVLSSTLLIVGYCDNQIANWPQINLSSWTVASGASIGAEWQPKNTIGTDDIVKAVYEADPVAAVRVLDVDQYGNPYTPTNPVPTENTGSAADKPWDDLLLARDPVTQDITVATYKLAGSTVRTLTFTYDAFENLIEVKKT